MFGFFSLLSCLAYAAAQGTSATLVFTDTTRAPIAGNYTMGYVNNTQENRCHRATTKFQAQQTGIVDSMVLGVYSRTTTETCGISFVLSTFPSALTIGSSLLTTFTDLVAATPGTDEYVSFNATPSVWGVVAGQNYTVTILPFTWITSPVGNGPTTHCVFDIPYGRPGLHYAAIGEYGPTALPCGSTPWTTDLAGDGVALQFQLTGHAATVTLPSSSSTVTPTPTSTHTPTSSQTGTPTPTGTPTASPTISETPSPSPSVGSSSSITSTGSRTPSRTPSISYSQTPTTSVTATQTPTGTSSPTPTIRIGASPSITPTETPGPTDSPSPTASFAPASLMAAAAPPATGASTGTLLGAVFGGAAAVVAIIGIAIRYNIISAQLNTVPTISAWTPGQKKKKMTVPDFAIGVNPIAQSSSFATRTPANN